MPIVHFDEVRFTYDGKSFALDGLTTAIEPGSFVCVLGGNGSGKSTFAKHINALLTPDEGVVETLGYDTRDPESLYFVRSNAGMVFQNPDDQIVASIIEDDVAFGPENLGIPSAEIQERVRAALHKVGLEGYGKQETSALSGGQKQRVAIAGVLAMGPQILILDEANAMLDPRGRAELLQTCRKLNEGGLTIVLITHFMEDAAYSDRVLVLDGGRVAMDGAPQEVLAQDARLRGLSLEPPFPVRMGRLLESAGVPVRPHITLAGLEDELKGLIADDTPLAPALSDRAAKKAQPVITFHDVSFTYEPASKKKQKRKRRSQDDSEIAWGNKAHNYWALEDVTLQVRRGEFLGIAGHTGSGKSTLIQLANGLLKPTGGRVLYEGADLSDKKQAIAARRDVGVVFQYPERQLFADTVFNDVAFGPRNLGLGESQAEMRVRESLRLVGLDYESLRDKSPFSLSGGQQRRVAIAGVLAMAPSVLVLDEPTAGLDPHAHGKLMRLVDDLRRFQDMTIILASHNMDDLARFCDRLVILNRGRIYADGTPFEVFGQQARLREIGLDIPDVLALAHGLGLEALLDCIPSPEELAGIIASLCRDGRPGGAR